MNTWTNDELTTIGNADELHISTQKQDGTLRNPVIIWVVRVGNDLYVRAVKGPTGKWYRHAMESKQGHIDADGISKDVHFIQANESINNEVDAAYKSKYSKYGASIVGSTLTSQAQAAIIKVLPK